MFINFPDKRRRRQSIALNKNNGKYFCVLTEIKISLVRDVLKSPIVEFHFYWAAFPLNRKFKHFSSFTWSSPTLFKWSIWYKHHDTIHSKRLTVSVKNVFHLIRRYTTQKHSQQMCIVKGMHVTDCVFDSLISDLKNSGGGNKLDSKSMMTLAPRLGRTRTHHSSTIIIL